MFRWLHLVAATALGWAALIVSPAVSHQVGSFKTGTETQSLPSVESCAVFKWTKKEACDLYDTMSHHWEVTNNCERGVRVGWANNAYDRPIKRGEESGKPKREFARNNLKPGKVLKSKVGCVDRAELEICIEYIYPRLKEHDVNCKGFFD